MNSNNKYKYNGVWPVAPTPFHDNGEVDYEGMKRVLDCMIDQKVDGICILANFSEQFLITDEEREKLTHLCIEHINGRVPTIVTVSHFSTKIVLDRVNLVKNVGGDIVMMMPPYHGSLLKGNADQTFEQFNQVSKIGLPIMIQDAPLSGVDLSVPLLTKMINEIENLTCFKIESAQAALKIKSLIDNCNNNLEAPFDGEESITLMADLHAGVSGTMSSALLPEKIGPVVRNYLEGNIDHSEKLYNQILPLINFENRQCGFRATKTVMKEGDVIKSDFCRHPIKPLDDTTKNLLLSTAKKYNLISINWAK